MHFHVDVIHTDTPATDLPIKAGSDEETVVQDWQLHFSTARNV